jgi:Cu2+-exporting ATPase
MNAPAEAFLHTADAAPGACYHCGQPCGAARRWQAMVDGAARAMCCPGCAAAAQAIADAGFADYYAERTAYAPQADAAGDIEPAWRLVDAAYPDGDAVFGVEGIRCAACVWLIERRVAALPGVADALLNVATERLRVRWDPALCRASDVLAALRAIGYTAQPYDAARHAARLDRERKTLFRRLFVAALSMMQVMMVAYPVYLADGDAVNAGTMDADMHALLGWASLLLALPAVVYSAWPILRGAIADLRRGVPGMDVPVALGIGGAFAGSVASLVRGTGAVYFDSITMFVFLLLGSRYLELGARRKAACALERLQRGAPASALRLTGYPASRATETVAAAALQPGDLVLVPAGQAVAADGVIVEGATDADFSLLNGESRTRALAPGDPLPGGAVNVAQAIVLRVTNGAADSTLALLVRLVERAGQAKPRLAQWADRIGAPFVLALLLVAGAVFAYWMWGSHPDPARAWAAAIAVLVVSCPCALSLATPAALAAATERLLRHGVLTVQPHVLETLARATHVVFDKTGTLTRGRPSVRLAQALGGARAPDCLRVAAALEADSAHPLAAALRAAAGAADMAGSAPLRAGALRTVVGEGVEGVIDGVSYRLGNLAFVAALAGAAAPAPGAAGVTSVWLGRADGWLARFDLADEIRPEAAAVLARLRASGKTVMLLSGDGIEAVQDVARRLGIEEAFGDRLPQDKLDFVRALQARGAIVAMVGDGINDAAVLGGADVSFAMGEGAQLAQLHADCVLLGEGLDPLTCALDTSCATLRVIRQNLGWALVYNLAAIPLAAGGVLNPWMCGLGMAASSGLVVANALRLRKD